MEELTKQYLDEVKMAMDHAYLHLQAVLSKINIGRASPTMIHDLKVDYHGVDTSLHQIATVATVDAHTLSIQPWESQIIGQIEKAIQESQLGLSTKNDGRTIMVHVPTPSQERRLKLVKLIKAEMEKSKITIRNVRRDYKELLKNSQKSGVPEDEIRRSEKKIQELTDLYIGKIDLLIETKEKDIITI